MAGLPPPTTQVAKWRRTFKEIATEEEIEDVYRTLLTLARGGDVTAIALWAKYVIGPPDKGAAAFSLRVDEASLDSVEDCIGAAQQLMRGQVAGVIDAPTAAALRSTIELALRAHQAADRSKRPTTGMEVEVTVESYERPAALPQADD